MPITFDKKGFRKTARWIKLGKKKYALRMTFLISLFYAVFASFFIAFTLDEIFSWKKVMLLFIVLFLFDFILNYFQMLRQWKSIISDYNETIDYWEKHDPTFFGGEMYEKID